MIQRLNITLVQYDLYWENPDANRATIEEMLSGIQTDLVVLPEMFTTGFSMNAKSLAEPMGGHTFKWMKMLASSLGAAVSGSIIIKEEGNYFNRFLWVNPDGTVAFYDKRHLFRMSDEVRIFTAGEERKVISYKGWKFLPQVCYDLRFPVWSRRTDNDYDVLLYTANWPASRNNVWETLLSARAIENQSYSVGVNRVGNDGLDIQYTGNSSVYNYMGYLVQSAESKSEIIQVDLNKKDLEEFREKFPVYLDSDSFTIDLKK